MKPATAIPKIVRNMFSPEFGPSPVVWTEPMCTRTR
jgi:hypothetical protein